MRYWDDRGVELAEVPSAGVSNIDPNAKSGNPRHDVRSGKFGDAPGDQNQDPQPPNIDPLEWARLRDAVRDAARQFEDFGEGEAKEFLSARARDPSQVDMQQFLTMVRSAHLDDLSDILDEQIRATGILPRASRRVTVKAPKGYVRKALNGLDADEIAQVMHRLEARGHDQTAIDAFFDKRNPKQHGDEAKAKRDAIQASDSGWSGMEFFAEAQEPEVDEALVGAHMDHAIQMAEALAKNMQPPVVTVQPQITVEAPKTRSVRKDVRRDESGLITQVVEVEEE